MERCMGRTSTGQHHWRQRMHRRSIVELTTVVTLDNLDGAPNCVKTKANFFDNVGKVSDFTRKENVNIKRE
jgi:hypothetical protein